MISARWTSDGGHSSMHRYFLRLAEEEGIPHGSTVFVATDELDHSWFWPTLSGAFKLVFADQLAQDPLYNALSAFPTAVWADVLAILEQIICMAASHGFVGSLPSTLSGHIVNARQVVADAAADAAADDGGADDDAAQTAPAVHDAAFDSAAGREEQGRGEPAPRTAPPVRHRRRPLFTKLHESCCDARTALDLLRLPGVDTLADVPCVPHDGNPWC